MLGWHDCVFWPDLDELVGVIEVSPFLTPQFKCTARTPRGFSVAFSVNSIPCSFLDKREKRKENGLVGWGGANQRKGYEPIKCWWQRATTACSAAVLWVSLLHRKVQVSLTQPSTWMIHHHPTTKFRVCLCHWNWWGGGLTVTVKYVNGRVFFSRKILVWMHSFVLFGVTVIVFFVKRSIIPVCFFLQKKVQRRFHLNSPLHPTTWWCGWHGHCIPIGVFLSPISFEAVHQDWKHLSLSIPFFYLRWPFQVWEETSTDSVFAILFEFNGSVNGHSLFRKATSFLVFSCWITRALTLPYFFFAFVCWTCDVFVPPPSPNCSLFLNYPIVDGWGTCLFCFVLFYCRLKFKLQFAPNKTCKFDWLKSRRGMLMDG